MRLEDGGGIGWTLCGEAMVPGVGRVTFECPWDPDFEVCWVNVDADRSPGELEKVLGWLGLTMAEVQQRFDVD